MASGLDVARLRKMLSGVVSAVSYRRSTISTNDDALKWRKPLDGPVLFLCAEQTAGRGRYGRTWLHGGEDSLAFSLLYPMSAKSAEGASLASGVAVAAGLTECGMEAMLKWPNDVIDAQGRKVGGILVEARDNPLRIVVGVGLNLRMTDRMRTELGEHAVGIRDDAGSEASQLDNTEVLAGIAASLATALYMHEKEGTAHLVQVWRRWAIHREGDSIYVSDSQGNKMSATYCGISDDGALLCKADGRVRKMYSAQVLAQNDPRN